MDTRQRPVSEIMRVEVATLGPKDKLDAVQDLMKLGRVRHLPVLDEGRLVGVVSNRDVLDAALSRTLDFDAGSRRTFLHSVEIGEVMTRDVATVGPDTTLAEAARVLVGRHIGCLPVVGPDGTMIGLVTETDLLEEAFLGGESADEDDEAADASTGSEFRAWMDRELEDLRRARDELRLKAHLGKAEVRDRWQALERSFEALEGRARRTSRAAGEPLRKLREDARKLAHDLREGYRQIRDSL
jgi:CBS domain-containing membrane protein